MADLGTPDGVPLYQALTGEGYKADRTTASKRNIILTIQLDGE